jgi:medium-chain acyl-[acyl-carrier-protein] hydrolase
MEATAFNETFTMPAVAEDDSERERLLVVLDAMQETAGRHAAKLGVGVRDLHAKGLTWVLARLHVKVTSVPAAGQPVHIATWPTGRYRLFAVRDFCLKDEAGKEILRATSAWALMNMESRRPARLDPHLPVFTVHPERMIEDDFAPLPPPYLQAPRTSYRAEPADIDLNDHVNNTVYLGWALRSTSESARLWKPLSLEAAFLGEARLGDEVTCLTENGRGESRVVLLQSLQGAASGRELTRLRTFWETGLKPKKTK